MKPERRYWASPLGLQACRAHGMDGRDVYFADPTMVLGLHDITILTVGGRPDWGDEGRQLRVVHGIHFEEVKDA